MNTIMIKNARYLAPLVFLGATTIACSDGDDMRQREMRLINGDVVANPEDVGLVSVHTSGKGSGYLLRNDWTLTAGHVLHHGNCRHGAPDAEGNLTADCRFNPIFHNVALGNGGVLAATSAQRVSVHPRYVPTHIGAISGVDVALIQTEPFSVGGSTTNINRSIAAGQTPSTPAGA